MTIVPSVCRFRSAHSMSMPPSKQFENVPDRFFFYAPRSAPLADPSASYADDL